MWPSANVEFTVHSPAPETFWLPGPGTYVSIATWNWLTQEWGPITPSGPLRILAPLDPRCNWPWTNEKLAYSFLSLVVFSSFNYSWNISIDLLGSKKTQKYFLVLIKDELVFQYTQTHPLHRTCFVEAFPAVASKGIGLVSCMHSAPPPPPHFSHLRKLMPWVHSTRTITKVNCSHYCSYYLTDTT